MGAAIKNNKALGSAWERKCCELLSADGWWVHFLSPDGRGAQPFDVIAVKDGRAVAIDCKTCKRGSFPLSRMEDNQKTAFAKWMRCGNTEARVAVLSGQKAYLVDYVELAREGKVQLGGREAWKDGVCL